MVRYLQRGLGPLSTCRCSGVLGVQLRYIRHTMQRFKLPALVTGKFEGAEATNAGLAMGELVAARTC